MTRKWWRLFSGSSTWRWPLLYPVRGALSSQARGKELSLRYWYCQKDMVEFKGSSSQNRTVNFFLNVPQNLLLQGNTAVNSAVYLWVFLHWAINWPTVAHNIWKDDSVFSLFLDFVKTRSSFDGDFLVASQWERQESKKEGSETRADGKEFNDTKRNTKDKTKKEQSWQKQNNFEAKIQYDCELYKKTNPHIDPQGTVVLVCFPTQLLSNLLFCTTLTATGNTIYSV